MTTPPPKNCWAIFAAIALLALLIRLPQLGERPMHTDEAINGYIIGQLLAGEAYHYDPQDRHGPVLYLLAKPVARWGGAQDFAGLTETKLRLTPVIVGSAMILLFGAAVEMLGFIPCLVAAVLFACAPLPVYYSRYFIHETLFVAATFGLMLCGWRTLKINSAWAAAGTGLCAALMLGCKETAVIHFFALAGAAMTGWLMTSRKHFPTVKVTAMSFIVFAAAAILLFTWGGHNWSAPGDLVRAISRFTARAGGEGHEKPFWYYLALLAGGWSGATLLGMAVVGLLPASRSSVRVSLAVYAVLTFVIYSVIPYKTPWLALNFWLPLALLAGIAVEWAWLARANLSCRCWISVFASVLGFLIAHDTYKLVFKIPADEKNPYAYAHTGEGLLGLPDRLEELIKAEHLTQPRIAVVMADAWPLPWYLRKFSNTGFWQPGQETGAADFYITPSDIDGKLAAQLKDYRPEFFGVRPNVLIILWRPEAAPVTP